ncbi:predicted protein [Plenodomus lingam JN3]|uniref:Predicted protein n=1 Tax=Leptosphaeria maculans (strain JN3 / isolate v23.1.3 / race Av1-4-5-6-7-8) TaxID=985895 RepID=E5AF01_LEPMJ|nr:predicted protein [Plenodomus lingam JN3]CBY01790.1 predicted protein [Plenodomus lingam JN3]
MVTMIKGTCMGWKGESSLHGDEVAQRVTKDACLIQGIAVYRIRDICRRHNMPRIRIMSMSMSMTMSMNRNMSKE